MQSCSREVCIGTKRHGWSRSSGERPDTCSLRGLKSFQASPKPLDVKGCEPSTLFDERSSTNSVTLLRSSVILPVGALRGSASSDLPSKEDSSMTPLGFLIPLHRKP